MQDGARFFAYSTWAIMISLGIIIFTHRFLEVAEHEFWLGLLAMVFISFLYFNLTFAATKRFITKVPAPTNAHILLAFLIFLPPVAFIFFLSDTIAANEILFSLIMAAGCYTGTIFGNKSGIKARYEYIEKLKELQKNM